MTDEELWPERLVLRDTKVFADEGQRIFTTATGYGYEKQEYVRADKADKDAASVALLHDGISAAAYEAEKAIRRADKAESDLARARDLLRDIQGWMPGWGYGKVATKMADRIDAELSRDKS